MTDGAQIYGASRDGRRHQGRVMDQFSGAQPFAAGGSGSKRESVSTPGRGGTGNLPLEMTSFVGRRREMAKVRHLLSVSRIVTLIGPGGVGKTRLALRVAAESIEQQLNPHIIEEIGRYHETTAPLEPALR